MSTFRERFTFKSGDIAISEGEFGSVRRVDRSTDFIAVDIEWLHTGKIETFVAAKDTPHVINELLGWRRLFFPKYTDWFHDHGRGGYYICYGSEESDETYTGDFMDIKEMSRFYVTIDKTRPSELDTVYGWHQQPRPNKGVTSPIMRTSKDTGEIVLVPNKVYPVYAIKLGRYKVWYGGEERGYIVPYTSHEISTRWIDLVDIDNEGDK